MEVGFGGQDIRAIAHQGRGQNDRDSRRRMESSEGKVGRDPGRRRLSDQAGEIVACLAEFLLHRRRQGLVSFQLGFAAKAGGPRLAALRLGGADDGDGRPIVGDDVVQNADLFPQPGDLHRLESDVSGERQIGCVGATTFGVHRRAGDFDPPARESEQVEAVTDRRADAV